jgi:hypothetical protein
MQSELSKFCIYNKNELQRNVFSKRFNRGKTFNGNLFLCFICLTDNIYCSNWKFEVSRNNIGTYDRLNCRYSSLQVRSSVSAIRDHIKIEHKLFLANRTQEQENCYVDLTPEINLNGWLVDKERKTTKQTKNRKKTEGSMSTQTDETDGDFSFTSETSSPSVGIQLFGDANTSSQQSVVQSNETYGDDSLNSLPSADTYPDQDVFSSVALQNDFSHECCLNLNDSLKYRKHTSTASHGQLVRRHTANTGYSSDEDEVIYGPLRSQITEHNQCFTPIAAKSTSPLGSNLNANDYVTNSGTLLKDRDSKGFLSAIFEPSYFTDTLDEVPVLVQSPQFSRRMVMNEHYSRFDYDYVASPIDPTIPLVTYGGEHHFRDFRDEGISPEGPSKSFHSTVSLSNNVSPLFPSENRMKVIQNTNKHKTITTASQFNESVKSLTKMISLNKQLIKYRPMVDNYAVLSRTLKSDCKTLTHELSVCNDRKKRGTIESCKYELMLYNSSMTICFQQKTC